MGDNSAISWTDATWNPIRSAINHGMVRWGCEKVSPGCDHCYASTLHVRHGGDEYPKEGTTPRNDIERELGLRAGREAMQLHEPTLTQPLRWKKPRMIFVCSMTDLFGDWVPDEWIDRVFAIMALAPQHTFQVLTKRAKRMRDYMALPRRFACWIEAASDIHADWRELARLPLREPGLENVWLGVSIESQDFAWRWNYLKETPAAVRFVSAEPLLGPLLLPNGYPDWLIIGGESGPGFRPMKREWALQLYWDAHLSGCKVWFKQDSGFRSGQGTDLLGSVVQEWPL